MTFWKYQGAGNDFVMLDQRQEQKLERTDTQRIAQLCDRRFGIGADGLILLQKREGYDFEMVYFNADGRESSMCGNGGRCIAAFARDLGLIRNICRFWAIDGEHEALVHEKGEYGETWVELKMGDVDLVERDGESFVLNTGSPHYVRFEAQIDTLDMLAEGRAVRYSERYKEAGINVNLVCQTPDALRIRTYERGVEDETFACGTGVTAAAIATFFREGLMPGKHEVAVKAKGGAMSVRFLARPDGSFSDIWLCGPAAFVFEGKIDL